MFSYVTNKCTKLTGAHVECLSLCLDKDKMDKIQEKGHSGGTKSES